MVEMLVIFHIWCLCVCVDGREGKTALCIQTGFRVLAGWVFLYLVCWNSDRQYVHFTTGKLPLQSYMTRKGFWGNTE